MLFDGVEDDEELFLTVDDLVVELEAGAETVLLLLTVFVFPLEVVARVLLVAVLELLETLLLLDVPLFFEVLDEYLLDTFELFTLLRLLKLELLFAILPRLVALREILLL